MAALAVAEFTELVTSTFRNYQDQLFDNVMTKHPLLDLLKENVSSKTGRALVVDLELGLDTSTTITDDSGSYSPVISDPIMGSAEFDWSNIIISHTRVEYKKLAMNSGQAKRHDLIKRHISNMMYAHGRQLVLALHARADLGEVAAGWFNSLDQLVGDDTYDADPKGDASNDFAFQVGGIDASSQSLWVATRRESPLDGNETIRKAFRELENDIYVATANKNMPNKICAGRNIFSEFVDSYDDKVRYTTYENKQAKFKEVEWGDIVVRLDPDCPVNRAYMIDTGSLEWADLDGNFMKQQPVKDVPNSLDQVTPAASILSIGVNERRANGVLLRPTTAGGDA